MYFHVEVVTVKNKHVEWNFGFVSCYCALGRPTSDKDQNTVQFTGAPKSKLHYLRSYSAHNQFGTGHELTLYRIQ
jgi:hypothetical protein